MKRAALFTLLVAGAAQAYWANNHKAINLQVLLEGEPFDFERSAVPIKTVHDYAQRVLYVSRGIFAETQGVVFNNGTQLQGTVNIPAADKPTDAPDGKFKLAMWNVQGGLWEDGFTNMDEATQWGGRRAVNHFHTPVSGTRNPSGGYGGLFRGAPNIPTGQPYADLFRSGISAIDWANGARSGTGVVTQKNEWGYPAVRESLTRLFTETARDRRESALSACFRAVGQVQHLIEDNTVPDHARDLAHPGDGFEEYMKDSRASLFGATPKASWKVLPLKKIERYGFRGFWDQDVLVSDPSASWSDTELVGISEFTSPNFYAWNRFTKALGLISHDFSTISVSAHSGWGPLLWPQWNVGPNPPYYINVSPSRPIVKLARSDPDTPAGEERAPILDGEVWSFYAEPLMERAHGYAQTVWSLALQPARAEIVPDPAAPLTRARLRLFNSHRAGDEHAVSWVLDEVRVLPQNAPMILPVFAAKNDPIAVPFAAGTKVSPGQMQESEVFTITYPQRLLFIYSTHTAVLIKAHLDNTERTPLELAVPIPNGYSLMKQTETIDQSPAGTASPAMCCDCGCGETVTGRQPMRQQVRGTHRLVPGERDILNRAADSVVRDAHAKDTRLAAIGMVGFPGVSHDVTSEQWPSSALFTFGGQNLEPAQGKPTLLIRRADAPDVPDQPEPAFTMDADIAQLATGTGDERFFSAAIGLNLAVWTTSGAMILHRIYLWLPDADAALPPVIGPNGLYDNSCSLFRATFVSHQRGGACRATGSSPMCGTGTFTSHAYAWTLAPLTGLGTVSSTTDLAVTATQIQSWMKIVSVSGQSIATSPLTGATMGVCTPGEIQALGGASSNGICPQINGGVLAYTSTHATGSGGCSSVPAPPALAYEARYKPLWGQNDTFFWNTQFGISAPPPDFELLLH